MHIDQKVSNFCGYSSRWDLISLFFVWPVQPEKAIDTGY